MININKWELEDALTEYYMKYSLKIIVDRSLPDVRDGLKPIHRRVLWKLFQLNLTSDKEKTKCQSIVGEVIKIHNHGDSSIYEALALLTEANESLLHPFIDGEGAFGKVYSTDSPSASRYTSGRLNKFAEEMFYEMKKNVVKFIGEDKDHLQPLALPNTFPNILIKPNNGMAVGEKCNFPSFNLGEVIDTTIAYMDNKDIDLLQYLTAPDFSSKAFVIHDADKFRDIYNTGVGSFKLRSKYYFDKTHNCIEVTEIPYNTTANAIIKNIIDLVKAKKIDGITDVRDETGFNTDLKKEELKIAIDVKRGTDVEKLMTKLYKSTPLETSFSCIFNCLVNYKPVTMGIKPILNEWIKFRMECIRNGMKYDIDSYEKQLHLYRGFKKILLNIDRAIAIIRESGSDSDIIKNLIIEFDVDEIQANKIADMKLREINKKHILTMIDSIATLEKALKNLKKMYESDSAIKDIIIQQLKDVKQKYAKPRLTKILYDVEDVAIEEEVEEYNCMYFFSKSQYFKKIRMTSLRSSGEHKLKDGDEITHEFNGNNTSEILFFSNKGVCYKTKGYQVKDTQTKNLGEYLPNMLNLEQGETIIDMVVTNDFKGDLLFAYANGKIARVTLSSYETKQNRSKLINAYNTDSPLVDIIFLEKDIDILCKSTMNKIVVINTEFLNAKPTRNQQGQQVLKCKDNSKMDLCIPLSEVDENFDAEFYRRTSVSTGYFLRMTDKL